MTQLSKEAKNLNWLVTNFVRKVPGVAHCIVVSSDGLLLAVSERLDRARAGPPRRGPRHRGASGRALPPGKSYLTSSQVSHRLRSVPRPDGFAPRAKPMPAQP